ncbi:MAG: Tm-1-like ATP-binding domain-containing protein [Anaerolineaceae bacterium]
MTKTVAIIGAFDSKGQEFTFLKSEIEKHGCKTFMINVGVLGEGPFKPDISADRVAEAGGSSLQKLAADKDRGVAMEVMTRGSAIVVKDLYKQGKFDGIISMGGSGGAVVGTSAMRALPVGVPKLMVTTVASGDTSAYVGTTDITMMPSIVDVSGLNRISRSIFANAAGAISGMVKVEKIASASDEKPLVAATMFGNTTRAVDHARKILEDKGFEVLVFHATGTGGRTMEMLVENGYFAGVLDMTTTEWADEVCGGVLSAGKTRLEAASKGGVPQVVTPACIDMCNFWAPETIPAKFKDRILYKWNPNITLMRTTPEENKQMGEIFAEKLNMAKGPVAVFIPMGGFSEVDFPEKPFWWPEANQAFVDALNENIRSDIPVVISDKDVNDPEFSAMVANKLSEFLKK